MVTSSPGLVYPDKIALVDGHVAGAAGERGADRAKFELEFGGGKSGFVGKYLGLQGAGGVGDFFELFLRDHLIGRE